MYSRHKLLGTKIYTSEFMFCDQLGWVPTYENLTSDFIRFLVLIYHIYRKKQNFLIPWDQFR